MGLGHGWSSRFGFARWVMVNAIMPTAIGWILLDVYVRGDPVGLNVILGFVAAWMIIVAIDTLARRGILNQSGVDDGWGRANHRYAPWWLVRKMYSAHQRTFPLAACQRGAIGKDIMVRRAGQGRQGGRRRQGGSPVKKASSDDGPGEPGEPPHQEPACTSDQQSFFSFQSAARILDCSPKTLRNKVSAGKIPAPIQTAIGPRFTADSLQAIIHPPIPVVVPPARPRGRPRISASNGKGGAA